MRKGHAESILFDWPSFVTILNRDIQDGPSRAEYKTLDMMYTETFPIYNYSRKMTPKNAGHNTDSVDKELNIDL